ncbi:MAG: LysE family transporter [Lautropia sp.]|nr:LysE family transporter [Lautropia sp.]
MNNFLRGALLGGGMIIAIGAQNAFLLKQGLLRNHVFWVALTCFGCDVLLMTLGVMGVGSALGASTGWSVALAVLGAVFLGSYAGRSFIGAWRGGHALVAGEAEAGGRLRSVVLATLGITLLNPHVYLDTVLVVGGVAGTLPYQGKLQFLAGALLASACWFFGLGYGARLLAPWFRKAVTWRILDALIGLFMLWIAAGLVAYALSRLGIWG